MEKHLGAEGRQLADHDRVDRDIPTCRRTGSI